MERKSRCLELLISGLVLLGIGILFCFLEESLNRITVLHYYLLLILQGVLLIAWGAIRAYQEYTEKVQAADEKEDAGQNAVESINASTILIVVSVLVIGYYMFALQVKPEVVGEVSPLHLVICVVTFVVLACVERWWSVQLDNNWEAASLCNLMVVNRIAIAALFVDLLTVFTGLVSVERYIDLVLLIVWAYVSILAVASVGVKIIRHGKSANFQIYVYFPKYSHGNQKSQGVLAWLENNTGMSVRSLWSLQYIRKIIPLCGLGVVLLLWLSTCLVQVESWQQGALYRFGRLSSEDILEPGLHLKLPIPFEEAVIVDVQKPQSMIVGYEGDVTSQNNLWTRPHEGEEQTLLLGNGNELVAINLKITYRISDLYNYLTNYAQPEDVLNAKGYEVVMEETMHTNIDTIISGDRSVLSHKIEEELKAFVGQTELGLEVMNVTLASIHPPVAIADIYQSVVSASIQKKTAVLTAEGAAMAAREQAQADSESAVNQAEIDQDERVSSAQAEVETYNASIEAYMKNAEAYYIQKYMQAVENTFAGTQKYLLSPDVDPGALFANFGLDYFQDPIVSEEIPIAEQGGEEATDDGQGTQGVPEGEQGEEAS